jgi:hypothetical protein
VGFAGVKGTSAQAKGASKWGRCSHLLARCYLGTMCMYTTTIRCSAIEGILHRYHRCGPIFMLEDKGIIGEVAYEWHLGYLGAIGLLNQRGVT